MAVTFLDAIEFSKIPGLNFVLPVVTSDPAPTAADEGRLIYNTTSNQVKYCDETPAWVALGPAGAGGPPTGAASGDLTGSYPGPTIAADKVDNAKLANMAANSIKGNNTGSAADPIDLSVAQTKTLLALDQVSNTSDANKPVSTATQTALNGKADNTVDLSAGNGLTGGGTIAANRAFNVGAGTGITVNADDVALNLTYTDGRYLLLSGGTLTNFLTLHADPSNPMHAATKQYVDMTAQGLDFKNSVKAATTANIASLAGGAPNTLDGVTLAANDRVLVKDQSTAAQNGIYTVTTLGTGSNGTWTRATDADANGEVSDGTLVPVEQGTVNADAHWICTSTTATPWVPGSSGSTWTRFTTVTDLVAGNGLTKTGTQIDVVGDATLTVTADQVSVASAPKWTTGRTIALTGDVTGTSAAFDGTGNLSIATTVVGAGTAAKHFAGDIPAGTSCVVTHNLNTRDVVVQVYRNSGNYDTVMCDQQRTSVNTVTLIFANAVSAGAYRCVVTGR